MESSRASRRRRLLRGVVLGTLAWSPIARAQRAARSYRVGVLRPTSAPRSVDRWSLEVELAARLARLGYAEGNNLAIAWRYADGDPARLPALARELVQLRSDVIVAVSEAAVRATRGVSATTPIIIWGNIDPVRLGLVASLARPGGNVTGVLIAPEGTLGAKKLELLKEAVPRARRIAVLAPPDPNSLRGQMPELAPAAAALGVELPVVDVQKNDYAGAFSRLAAARPDALFLLASTFFVRDRRPIIELAAKYRLPAMWEWREQVADGGLMSYGSSLAERIQRIAEYIDRIFRGADPSSLPVDQPTTFKLSINLKAAQAIGLTLPKPLLLRADDVIE